jgi:hypothetical protein
MAERLLVRILVAVALCMAVVAFALAPVPVDVEGNPDLPAPAFEQPGLYRMEVALLVFYGLLLLATPALTGLLRGRLPTEISTRGAKFAEGASRSAELDEAAVKKLEATTKDLAQGLADANLEINRIRKFAGRDNTQPEVDSRL